MYARLIAIMSVAMLGGFLMPAVAQAQSELPRNRSIYFNIHADTANPESPVVVSIQVSLDAREREGHVVGWYPLWVAITQYGPQGEVVESWTQFDPLLLDDLWYVAHENPLEPTSEEFTNPPELSGTAEADTLNGPTLAYYIAGKNPGTPPVAPYPITSILDYSFQRSDELDPIDEDEDEPVDIPEGEDDSN